jgi:ribonuclease Z
VAEVLVIGAGTPIPTAERWGSAFVVEIGGDRLMFDCGPAATYKLVKLGLRPTDIEYLYFTHHHFDHDVDYPCFLLTRWDLGTGREAPLRVYGPAPTETITDRLIGDTGAFAFDWRSRLEHPLTQRGYRNRGGVLPRPVPAETVIARDVGPGPVHAAAEWRVTAAPADHFQPYLDSLAYRLEGAEGSIVFTGDTQPCRSVIDLARGADLLICMCSADEIALEARRENFAQCGTLGAAAMAAEAGVKKLALVHVGPQLAAPGAMEKGIAAVAKVYDGEIVFARELMTIRL